MRACVLRRGLERQMRAECSAGERTCALWHVDVQQTAPLRASAAAGLEPPVSLFLSIDEAILRSGLAPENTAPLIFDFIRA